MGSAVEYTATPSAERRGVSNAYRSSRQRHPAALAAASLGGVFMLVFGLWAFFAPVSFAAFVAFPYNRHLVHDAGAFQIGIGVALLLALVWADSLAVALGGFVAGSGFHLASHAMDRHLGGHDTDLPGLGLLLLIGGCGLWARSRDLAPAATVEQDVPSPLLAPFVRQRNVLLTTYRRDGTPKGTPVHIVVCGAVAYFRTWDATWKMKRIRNNATVTIVPSTARGTPTGPAIRARARVLGGAEATIAARALARKYPVLHGIVIPLLHRLRGYHTVYIAVSPCDD